MASALGRVMAGDAKFVFVTSGYRNVYLSRNYKDCRNVQVFFQGPLKLICACVKISHVRRTYGLIIRYFDFSQ